MDRLESTPEVPQDLLSLLMEGMEAELRFVSGRTWFRACAGGVVTPRWLHWRGV